MRFDPWVGENYGKKPNSIDGKRLLILGESHYTKEVEEIGTTNADFTKWVVENIAIPKRHPFFDKILGAVLCRDWKTVTTPDADAFWHSVAFYNYVPVFADGRSKALGGANRRPTDAMFAQGAIQFCHVLRQLEPEAVIVCGLTLWNWVAPHLYGFTGKPRDVIFYDDCRTVFARIHHPSYRGFDPGKWCERVRRLLSLTDEARQCGRKIMWQDDEDDEPRDPES